MNSIVPSDQGPRKSPKFGFKDSSAIIVSVWLIVVSYFFWEESLFGLDLLDEIAKYFLLVLGLIGLLGVYVKFFGLDSHILRVMRFKDKDK